MGGRYSRARKLISAAVLFSAGWFGAVSAQTVVPTPVPGPGPAAMPPSQLPSGPLPQPPNVTPPPGLGVRIPPQSNFDMSPVTGDADVPSLNPPLEDVSLDGRNYHVAPRDSHWMLWWEANRAMYWPQPLETEELREAARKAADTRSISDAVAAALEKAAKSRQTTVRAHAALALGMSRHPRAAALLSTLITDADDTTAIHAWAALGLMGTDAASKLYPKSPRPRDTIGFALCIGLHPKPDDAAWDILSRQAKQSDVPEARRLALWALRMHRAPGTHELAMQLIQTTRDRDLFAEAILALGAMNQPQGARMIIDLIRMSEAARAIPLIANDPDFQAELTQTSTGVVPPPAAPRSRGSGGSTRITGIPHDYRAIAILASTQLQPPSAEATDAIRTFVGARNLGPAANIGRTQAALSPSGLSPEDPARMIALGMVGRSDDGALLNDAFRVDFSKYVPSQRVNRTTTSTDLRRFIQYPARPVAAIGLGLALRRSGDGLLGAGGVSPETGAALPDGTGDLANQLQLATEMVDVRIACAVALGLSRHQASANRLKAALRNVAAGEEQIYGFTILGLGLLGDAEAVDLAAGALGTGPATFSLDAITAVDRNRGAVLMPAEELIARRAIVDGLAALGDPRALPILFKQWGQDDTLTLDTARAIARCLRPGVMERSPTELNAVLNSYTKALIDAINADTSSRVSGLAAASLGMLYASPDMFYRLGTITAGNDYTVRPAASSNSRLDLTRAYPLAIFRLSNPFYASALR